MDSGYYAPSMPRDLLMLIEQVKELQATPIKYTPGIDLLLQHDTLTFSVTHPVIKGITCQCVFQLSPQVKRYLDTFTLTIRDQHARVYKFSPEGTIRISLPFDNAYRYSYTLIITYKYGEKSEEQQLVDELNAQLGSCDLFEEAAGEFALTFGGKRVGSYTVTSKKDNMCSFALNIDHAFPLEVTLYRKGRGKYRGPDILEQGQSIVWKELPEDEYNLRLKISSTV